jgi:hypothetical protein
MHQKSHVRALLPEARRRTVFEDDVETLRLPLSGVLCQRRRDGRWRFVPQAQSDDEQAGHHTARPDDWVSPDVPVEGEGWAEWAPGSHDEASWWLLYGDNREGPVTVTLLDGGTPPILTFGPLWVCEWVSPWQEALVTTGSESYKAFHRISPSVLTRDKRDE